MRPIDRPGELTTMAGNSPLVYIVNSNPNASEPLQLVFEQNGCRTSLAFKLYLASFANYNETYGSLGGVIVLMLWFYITGLAILAGAEMNAEIEHASPHGKDPGEKVPGQRKRARRASCTGIRGWQWTTRQP